MNSIPLESHRAFISIVSRRVPGVRGMGTIYTRPGGAGTVGRAWKIIPGRRRTNWCPGPEPPKLPLVPPTVSHADLGGPYSDPAF